MHVRDVLFVDFRRSELTNFQELTKSSAYRSWGAKDVIALVSSNRSQIIWVKGFYIIIGDYARQAGMIITNFGVIEKKLAPLKKQVKALKKEWGMLKVA